MYSNVGGDQYLKIFFSTPSGRYVSFNNIYKYRI